MDRIVVLIFGLTSSSSSSSSGILNSVNRWVFLKIKTSFFVKALLEDKMKYNFQPIDRCVMLEGQRRMLKLHGIRWAVEDGKVGDFVVCRFR